MLKRKTPGDNQTSASLEGKGSKALFNDAQDDSKGILENLMSGYSKVLIEDPVRPFYVDELQEVVSNVDYGILQALEGTWVSYNNSDQSKRKMNGTGIHTTIMPSPGTNSGNIPGKYSFECEEYIEKLTFNLVPGGVRNRGGGKRAVLRSR